MSLSHLILGLLTDGDFTGYDLNKVFQDTVGHFWTTDQSQIYRALHKMSDKGWVDAETVIQEDNPNKKVYSITSTGLDELKQWLTKPLNVLSPIREAELGQLFFGDNIERRELITVYEHYLHDYRERLATYSAYKAMLTEQIGDQDLPYKYRLRILTLDFGIRQMRFQVQWVEEVLDTLKQEHQ